MSTCARNTYRPEIVAEMIKNIANCKKLTSCEQLAFNSLVQNLGFNLCNMESQIAVLKATMLSKISNAFLEKDNHNFSGTLTMSSSVTMTGTTTFTGTVVGLITPEVLTTELSVFISAVTATLVPPVAPSIQPVLPVEIKFDVNYPFPLAGYYEITNPDQAASTGNYQIGFYGGPLTAAVRSTIPPSPSTITGAGVFIKYTIRTPYGLNGALYTPVIATTFTEADASITPPPLPITTPSTPINNVNINAPFGFTAANYSVQEVTLRYLINPAVVGGTATYFAFSTTSYY
jgi:hypothetical protein